MSKKRVSGAWVDDTPHIYNTSTDTFSTLPHEVIGDGQSNLTWSMDGNMQVSGTPTPQNPITPQETGEKTANLFSSAWEQGNINSSTGENVPANNSIRTADYIPIKQDTIYSMSRDISGGYIVLRLYNANKEYIGGGSNSTIRLITGTSASNPMRDDDKFCCFEIIASASYIRFGDTTNNLNTQFMMVEGQYTAQTMPTYEPYGQYKIPISFGQGNYISYLAEPIRKIGTAVDTMASTGTTTHNITKYEFTGNESITKVNSTATNYLYYIVFTGTAIGGAMCSHLQYLSSGVSDNVGFSQNQTYPNTFYFNLGADVMNAQTSGNTAEGFKEWLTAQFAAGTPLTLWRILETPTTETFTAPSIPTSGTAQTFDVSTTLKPSEVSLTYHGWHDHTDTKYTSG